PFLTLSRSIAPASFCPLYFAAISLNPGPTSFLSIEWQAMHAFLLASSSATFESAAGNPVADAYPAAAVSAIKIRFIVASLTSSRYSDFSRSAFKDPAGTTRWPPAPWRLPLRLQRSGRDPAPTGRFGLLTRS